MAKRILTWEIALAVLLGAPAIALVYFFIYQRAKAPTEKARRI